MQHIGLWNSNLGPLQGSQSSVCGGHGAVLSLLSPSSVLPDLGCPACPHGPCPKACRFSPDLTQGIFPSSGPHLFLSFSEWSSFGSVIRQATLSFSSLSGTQSEPSTGDHQAVSSFFNCSVCCKGAEIFLLLAWCEIKAGRVTLVGSGVWTLHHIS